MQPATPRLEQLLVTSVPRYQDIIGYIDYPVTQSYEMQRSGNIADLAATDPRQAIASILASRVHDGRLVLRHQTPRGGIRFTDGAERTVQTLVQCFGLIDPNKYIDQRTGILHGPAIRATIEGWLKAWTTPGSAVSIDLNHPAYENRFIFSGRFRAVLAGVWKGLEEQQAEALAKLGQTSFVVSPREPGDGDVRGSHESRGFNWKNLLGGSGS